MRRLIHTALLCSLSLTLLAQTPAPKWDVQAPFGPTLDVTFETTEGTWMSVDVSPDGRTIVFDLLGDIYTMPIAGGRATRVLGGPAFEMQPRFSPDGTRIAFSSDRGGLWNIWTSKTDGTDLRQISTEARWYINSPTWSPDGSMIYARRHFVGTRSGGAGEVWMYHASGAAGAGVQVTRRDNDQKDAGEPAVSPDGKYLYYSKDVTPGSTFEYNKDPHGVIFAVLRRDLETGRERTILSRPGGSIAPRPSPDGRFLSFVRRVGLGSRLFVMELATGEERSVFDRLDKDLQEAWTIQGVYPQYAWTPDSQGIVIWGEGRIWNVDVAGRQGTEVPFTAIVQQTLTPALRVKVPVHQDRFDVKMLRDARVAPDGRAVAYSALGRIYVRSLPDGEPRRITDASATPMTDPIELDPVWSPDGVRLAYTTWHDERLGRVVVQDVSARVPREVVTSPGHYIEPSFSPDGRWIAYRKATSDGTRARAGSMEPGLYVVPADGSAPPRLVREGGVEPEFDHTGTRLYFREQRAQFVLASVKLDGTEEIVHLQSANAMEVAPSPDGRWVAWSERWQLHVMPFPRTGRPIDISPGTRAMPSARISRDAGFYVHWSADSRRVHWMLGPELFTRDLDRTFAFLTDGQSAADAPEQSGRHIGFQAVADVPDRTLALTGARIITMARAEGAPAVIENGTIVIQGNRISAVGPANRVTIPAGAERIDVRGKTIIPGMIDAHAHVGGEGSGITAQQSWPLLANLAFGVTTLHDPSNDLEVVFGNAEMIKAGLKPGPRLFSTGRILYGAETNFKADITTYEDALSHLRRLKAVGAHSVKSYNQQRRDVRQMILKAARELDLNVVPEGGSLYFVNATQVIDGHTTVEHNLPVPVLYHDIVQVFARSSVGYTPTLVVSYGSLSGEYYWYQHMNVWQHERLLRFVPGDVVGPRSRRRPMAEEGDYGHVLISRGARQLADAGVPVNMGAHGQLQGLGAHWETWMLSQGGMTPMQALKAATIDPAISLGLDAEIGSLEPGKLADLVVLDRNPLENIRYTDSLFRVMLNGRLYDQQLNEVGGTARRPLWFHGTQSAN
ncbi:MAG TPA: amidohydrolase family protein [Vicinamibacterales bacterium]|nr:amidohydrolase family protein [Vicinamibacterales bacterium]